MNNISKGLLIALAITWSNLAFSVQSDEQTADTATPAEKTTVADGALLSGNGWQLIRKLEMGNSGKFVQMVLIEKGRQADKTIYSNAITRLCANEKEFCRIRFWAQKYLIPEKVSLTLVQQKAQQADHLVNRKAGIERTLWACTIDATDDACLQ
ncbi:hypothetical protein Nstercoris_02042 [Nitrosomonas stercoris]|uniref:DUF4189 domain-containing protein n=1 Tax=Nitrosomonas stercoris TaxID=1444684 RepID=A0A4Y1YNP3_9PROT|nr:hypothetical protein Nstercoris_02042 [Nitrosomonas stercoris]